MSKSKFVYTSSDGEYCFYTDKEVEILTTLDRDVLQLIQEWGESKNLDLKFCIEVNYSEIQCGFRVECSESRLMFRLKFSEYLR